MTTVTEQFSDRHFQVQIVSVCASRMFRIPPLKTFFDVGEVIGQIPERGDGFPLCGTIRVVDRQLIDKKRRLVRVDYVKISEFPRLA